MSLGRGGVGVGLGWGRVGCCFGAYMQLSKLSADDCHQQIQGKVGADHNQAEVVDDHHIADTVQEVVHLCRGPTLQ